MMNMLRKIETKLEPMETLQRRQRHIEDVNEDEEVEEEATSDLQQGDEIFL